MEKGKCAHHQNQVKNRRKELFAITLMFLAVLQDAKAAQVPARQLVRLVQRLRQTPAG